MSCPDASVTLPSTMAMTMTMTVSMTMPMPLSIPPPLSLSTSMPPSVISRGLLSCGTALK